MKGATYRPSSDAENTTTESHDENGFEGPIRDRYNTNTGTNPSV